MTASPLVPTPTLDDRAAEAADRGTARATARLSRYRMHTDRPGLRLRAGEVILGTPYASTEATMVVPVRCETDGHNPGALLSTDELEDLGPTDELLGPCSWGKPGVRH
ncbi:UNVERIFIED_CONTAM: hypothetical protein RF653_08835 [Kocuria sp. CPCC 205316]|uniref:hypothetical protein n=1 Tax=Kocuria TaxID=57493 RepID=UPI0034D5958A